MDLVSSLRKCSNSTNKHISFHHTKIFLLAISPLALGNIMSRHAQLSVHHMDVPMTIFMFHKTCYDALDLTLN